MMTLISSYIRRGRHRLRSFSLDPRVHQWLRMGGQFLSGLVLSAASLANSPQPLALGLVCAGSGWPAMVTALGAGVGYWLFWGQAGLQGILWIGLGLICALALGDGQLVRDTPGLLPSIAGLIAAASGVIFQFWLADETSIPVYLLRVGLAAASAALFQVVLHRRDPIGDWLAGAAAVLALAQIAPLSYLNLGFVAAGAIGGAGAFPAAALAGLALDLARVSKIPMTAVLALAFFLRMIPWGNKWMACLTPGIGFAAVMALSGTWDLAPLPALVLGGLLSVFLPGQTQVSHRRGETGMAQVRLEMAAEVLAQAEQLLLEAREAPIDEEAIFSRAVERACGGCAARKACRDRENLCSMPPLILHRPLLEEKDLPVRCKKTGRLLAELHLSQEQLRSLRSGRDRQQECRGAVIQQYQFLSYYLQDLADQLAQRGKEPEPRFEAIVNVCSNRPEADNGDKCQWFAGTGCRYYVALCDGMGTGIGAADEAQTALRMLRGLLSAGFPAEFALRSVNSICALRDQAGAVTMDLAEIRLDTGKAAVYKWGAAPSWLITRAGTEKIGTAGPPPGLSVTDARETVERLSLRRGEWLVLASDGAGGEETLGRLAWTPEAPPGEMAEALLEERQDASDDATIVFIRLIPAT